MNEQDDRNREPTLDEGVRCPWCSTVTIFGLFAKIGCVWCAASRAEHIGTCCLKYETKEGN